MSVGSAGNVKMGGLFSDGRKRLFSLASLVSFLLETIYFLGQAFFISLEAIFFWDDISGNGERRQSPFLALLGCHLAFNKRFFGMRFLETKRCP